eukprot:SAG22_NODE_10639_length_523_cov_1.825472_1_plen_31_part_10
MRALVSVGDVLAVVLCAVVFGMAAMGQAQVL